MDTTTIGQIAALKRMNVAELKGEWLRLFGEPAPSSNKDYLWRRLAYRVQELAHGGLSGSAKDRLAELAPADLVPAKTSPKTAITDETRPSETRSVRDPRLPTPGTVITRQYRGRELRLIVRDDGFELDGQAFRSLSEAARHVTGARWNGRLFWGLTKRKRG